MRIRMAAYLFIAVFCSLVILSTNAFSASITDSRNLERKIDRTREEIARQKRREKSVMTDLTKRQRELSILEGRYGRIQDKLVTVEKQYESNKTELRTLRNDLKILGQELQTKKGHFDQRVVALYKYGPQSYLEILLNAKDFGDLISKYTTVNYVVQNDLRLIKELTGIKEEIEQKKEAVALKTGEVEVEFNRTMVLKRQITIEQESISSKVDLTKKELVKIQSDRNKLEKALQELEETSKEIENAIKRDQGLAGAGGAMGSGKMLWPVRGRISSNFGWRYHPVLKKKKYHSGLDIAVVKGTQVLAADGGVVLVSGWRGGYGNFVAIDHGNGIATCYGHNSRLLVKVGEKVTKGQKVALSGSTGLSSGPHVHFEVRLQGTPINPMPYLP